MDQLQEKKQKAIQENNTILYNSIIVYEKMGSALPLLDIIEQQSKQIHELESEIVVLKNVNNSI